MILEAPDAATAAVCAGASRLELASALTLGGLTPSAALIERVIADVDVPVAVLVRPRPGDFLYSEREYEVLLSDVRRAVSSGAHGVVLGALTADGAVDARRLRAAVEAAGGAEVTFHRAFDAARDPTDALQQLVDCGVRRVLTTGGASTAIEGLAKLRGLAAKAAGRLDVVAAGGVCSEHVDAFRSAGIEHLHASAARTGPSGMAYRGDLGSLAARAVPRVDELREVDEAEVRALVGAARAG